MDSHHNNNPIFGQPSTDEQQPNCHHAAAVVSTGGRNQYVELQRFDSEEEFQNWLQSQGKKWGIVQKGRITIEDIIDQYACVFRRRKGYACRVQMRVRHNRRSSHKVVEVLPIQHDHNFYGSALPNEFDDTISMVNQQSMANNFDPSFVSSMAHDSLNEENALLENDQMNNGGNHFDNSSRMDQEINFSALLEQMGATGEQQQPTAAQPMEMLWSNILNNPTIQQFANVGMGDEGHGDLSYPMNHGPQQDQQDDTFAEQLNDNVEEVATNVVQSMNETEALTNLIAEKVANYLSAQLESKFNSIFTAIGTLTKSVDELKRSVAKQQSPSNKFMPMNQQASKSNRAFPPSQQQQQQQHNSAIGVPDHQNKPATPLQQLQNPQNGVSSSSNNNHFPTFPAVKSSPSINQQSINQQQQMFNNSNLSISNFASQLLTTIKQEPSIHQKPPAFRSPLPLSMRASHLLANKAKFGLGISLNSPMKSSRKSVAVYRQRRRELSYRFMKEVGMSLSIGGVSKSIFLWRANEIFTACLAKRRELAETGKRVIYRGNDVTDKIYRVDCSRDLVNGRRCGQMIADSLWPRGYFQRRMLMPILKGVSHRSKKRGDGSARKAVANDQFEIFKVSLLLLGGFLMDEADRSKWMETAREGVNQRGLDELANSKRAHYEYEGGPLFEFDLEIVDDEGEEGGGGIEEDRESVDQGEIVGDDEVEDVTKQQQQHSEPIPANLDFLRSFYDALGKEEEMRGQPPSPTPLYQNVVANDDGGIGDVESGTQNMNGTFT